MRRFYNANEQIPIWGGVFAPFWMVALALGAVWANVIVWCVIGIAEAVKYVVG